MPERPTGPLDIYFGIVCLDEGVLTGQNDEERKCERRSITEDEDRIARRKFRKLRRRQIKHMRQVAKTRGRSIEFVESLARTCREDDSHPAAVLKTNLGIKCLKRMAANRLRIDQRIHAKEKK